MPITEAPNTNLQQVAANQEPTFAASVASPPIVKTPLAPWLKPSADAAVVPEPGKSKLSLQQIQQLQEEEERKRGAEQPETVRFSVLDRC